MLLPFSGEGSGIPVAGLHHPDSSSRVPFSNDISERYGLEFQSGVNASAVRTAARRCHCNGQGTSMSHEPPSPRFNSLLIGDELDQPTLRTVDSCCRGLFRRSKNKVKKRKLNLVLKYLSSTWTESCLSAFVTTFTAFVKRELRLSLPRHYSAL